VTWATASISSRSLMTEHLHEKGERDRETHRDTGRQRSEPEDGKHARQA